ncbi:inositol polyphosphate multikinase-like [Amblyomma americanum]|uniref:Kinase n=1 Tax=Amblyomma americanum TaxID=6943 RepID=A0AAQ4FI09_AMBAM
MKEGTPLPDGTLLFDYQIAGHVHGSKKTKLGLLKHKDGSILKPLLSCDERTLREHKFYERVFSAQESPPELLNLRAFLPKYLGTWKTNFLGQEVEYLRLEDVTREFRRPSVMDVKIGAQTYDPLATPEKAALEDAKYPWSRQLGFRILGMRVFDKHEQKYCIYGKDYGLKQTPDTILDAFQTFLGMTLQQPNVPTFLPDLLAQLEHIRRWFETQHQYAFYSSSVLIVYESQTDSSDSKAVRCVAKMIDFAHVFPTLEYDKNYLHGLCKLISVLREIAHA